MSPQLYKISHFVLVGRNRWGSPRSALSSMEKENNIELAVAKDSPLTVYDSESGSYKLLNQRNCFFRCANCVNLSEADSYIDDNGSDWKFVAECQYCVRRAINLLGYYEHGIVPQLEVSNLPKRRDRLSGDSSLFDVLEQIAKKD